MEIVRLGKDLQQHRQYFAGKQELPPDSAYLKEIVNRVNERKTKNVLIQLKGIHNETKIKQQFQSFATVYKNLAPYLKPGYLKGTEMVLASDMVAGVNGTEFDVITRRVERGENCADFLSSKKNTK